ncbi:iron complex outermembrane receptor protein [Caulobacter rhizosphaerae]|uniref:Iron complex outermembrane receptor protein n=1 Tax=Caulobacter rhizosphaerae TaxID=2010972 RepID=A0ABU1N624_9CAUL|nr:TonB-dependent receptor [Caulobacter rhizosphaerae]MDR6533531.1 iron complex outermembrane receptor protein [Caulobacter rhizosphaerae]
MKRNFGMAARRAGLLTGVAALALCGAARAADAPPPAAPAAASAAAEGSVSLEQVVVTAQKRKTDLQDTPIAISAMDSEALKARHVQSIEDLGDGAIPSLRVAPFFARKSALTIGMRGIGALGDANQPARDQAVGVYVNGVYLGRAQGLGSALYDVERIEVLKGPQGTLFGRNTEGGAVSIVTKAPTGVFGMNTTVGYGDYNAYKAETHLDLPAFHGVSVKIDALLSKRGGTTTNPTTSGQPDFNSYDKRGVNLEAAWKPSDHFNADYAFDVSYDGSTPYYVQLEKKGSLALAPLTPLQPDRAKRANVGVPLQMSEGDTRGHRLNLTWTLADDLELKSISSYRKLTQTQFDNGAVALSVFAPNGPFARYSVARVWQDQYSQELQLVGKTERLDYVAGVFYFREKVSDNAQTPNSLQWNATGTGYTQLSIDFNTVPKDRASRVTTTSYGAFGQASWTPPVLDDRAHVTVGGRITRDAKKGSLDVVNGALPSYVDANKNTVVGAIPLDESWSHFDPLVSVAYELTPEVNLYGRWSTGYKAGGANSRSLTYRAFDPEKVKMFEVGTKTEFWDHRVRLNVAAFTGDIKDAQVDFNVIIVGNNRGTLETTNAASGKTKGVELDFALLPMEGLTLSGAYAYTDVKLSKAFNPFTNAQSTIYPLYSPRNAGSVAVDYVHPALGATFKAHLDANFADSQFTSTTDPTRSDKSFTVNGRLALADIRLGDGAPDLQLSVWSRNLTNESYAFLRNTNAALGRYAIYNEPRTFGVEANVKF